MPQFEEGVMALCVKKNVCVFYIELAKCAGASVTLPWPFQEGKVWE
jgi:hypothetical protein